MDEIRTLAREEFLKRLRDGLNNLYDAVHLRQSPLADLFGVANRFDTAAALRSLLVEAINSLKPAADEPAHSRVWRIYEALSCCYVQQLSQEMAADQLGLSARQLRRELQVALEVLADRLYERYDLEAKLRESVEIAASTVAVTSAIREELAWLKDMPSETPTDLAQALPAVLELAQPLAAQHGVQLRAQVAENLSPVAAHPIAVEQALLSLLSVAVAQADDDAVLIAARPLHWDVEVEVRGGRARADAPPPEVVQSILETAHYLVSLCGGRLAVSEGEPRFRATLTLPAVGQVTVLAVDDNADTLQLLQRYTTNTRYQLVGARDPELTFDLVERHSPQIVVLDVMMPQQDGWKVLARLRQHPRTGDIPVVVCTVLAQEALALSLGASDFVRKPVTRPAFLAALDRQVAALAPAPR